MYKIGDKFIIEIDEVFENKDKTLYRIKGFNSLVFDKVELEKLKSIEINWINVNEKLPTNYDLVIVSIKDETGDTSYNYTNVGWYSGQGHKFIVDNEYNNYVTHWTPLPKPFTKTIPITEKDKQDDGNCKYYTESPKAIFTYDKYTGKCDGSYTIQQGHCMGTKNCEEVNCQGKKSKCETNGYCFLMD